MSPQISLEPARVSGKVPQSSLPLIPLPDVTHPRIATGIAIAWGTAAAAAFVSTELQMLIVILVLVGIDVHLTQMLIVCWILGIQATWKIPLLVMLSDTMYLWKDWPLHLYRLPLQIHREKTKNLHKIRPPFGRYISCKTKIESSFLPSEVASLDHHLY